MKGKIEKAVYIAVRTVFLCLGIFPLYVGQKLGAILGNLIFLCDAKHRNIALDNLTAAFGHKTGPGHIRKLARKIFQNLGQLIFEIGWSQRLKRGDFDKYFSIEGLARLTNAFDKGKGVLILTAHVGNWELLTIIAAMTGYPHSIVVRPLDFGPLDKFFTRLRTRFGGTLIPKKHSLRMVLRSLQRGEMIGLLMDQNVDWYDGVFVDFFGRLACANKGLALLALKTGAPVVPLFLVRRKSSFVAEFGREVPLVQTGSKIKDVEANTQQYTKIIESFVCRYPDQWLWAHQRWKTRPYHRWPRE